MKRVLLIVGLMGLAGCVEPVHSDLDTIATAPVPQAAYGMSEMEADATVREILAANGCSMSFNAFQEQLDARGLDPAYVDPTTEAGQLTLAKRRILEIAIQTMAENGALRRSGWTFTSDTGACA